MRCASLQMRLLVRESCTSVPFTFVVMRRSLGTFGMSPRGSSVREMDRSQRQEYFRWGPLVKQIGFSDDT